MIIGAEYAVEPNVSEEDYARGLLLMVKHLLKEWTSENMIEDAYDQEKEEIHQNYDKYER